MIKRSQKVQQKKKRPLFKKLPHSPKKNIKQSDILKKYNQEQDKI